MKRNLVLAACALVVVLGASEAVLRITHAFGARLAWTEPDPEIGWRFRPGREYWFFNENDHAIAGRINTMGWRDRERARAKNAATRVAVVGDSYVEAFQVELDSTFAAVAERIANARGRRGVERFEFMNFGRSGMGPAEERIVLDRDVLPCDPDVVVFLFTPTNDIADVRRATAPDLLRPFYTVDARDSLVLDTSFARSRGYRVRAFLSPLKQRSALVSLVMDRYNAARVARNVREVARDASTSGRGLTRVQTLMTDRPDAAFLANYIFAKRIVADAARACAARGVAFALASVPVAYEADDVAQLRARDPSVDPDYFDRDLATLADTSAFGFVPLTTAFAERDRAAGKPLHWAHWNYDGHRLVGEALADSLAPAR